MVKLIAEAGQKVAEEKAPFKMRIELNGEVHEFDTWPSRWIMCDPAMDNTYTEQEFLDELILEYGCNTRAGLFDMLYEGNLIADVVKSASVEVIAK